MANASALPHLKVSTVDSMPYIYREVDSNGVTYAGFLRDLMDEVSRRAGFTYEFQQSSDGNYGSDTPRGWTGVVGDVVNGRADIGGHLVVSAAREDVVDFTRPFMSNGVNLLIRKPTWYDLGLGYLVRPLSSDYWIMLLVVLLLIGLVFFAIGKFSPYEWGNVAADKDPRGAKNSFTLRNSYMFALTTLSWQGFREAPKSLSGRIMAAFWMFFVLCTLVAYTANLTAYFLARPEQIPDLKFHSYEELLESDIEMIALSYGSTETALRTSRSKTLRAIWGKMNSKGSFIKTQKEGIERVKSDGTDYAFFMDTKTAEYAASHNDKCDLMLYGETLFPNSVAMAVTKGSVWRIKISDAIDELKSVGFVEELINKYWKFGGKCKNIDGRQYSSEGGFLSSMPVYPVTLKDMAVAILLLFLGFIAAMVFLVAEIVYYAVTKKGKKIEKPKILNKIEKPKIFKSKGKSAKAAPSSSVEVECDPEAGPSSDGLENVPLDGIEESQEAGPSDEIMSEEQAEEKAEV